MTNFNKNKIIMMAAGVALLGILALYFAPGVYRTYKSFISGGTNWIMGEMGEKGERGERGIMGEMGTNGVNGVNGENGTNGTYIHPTHRFTFQYPPGFNIAAFEEGEGEVVLIKSQIPNPNFQTNPNDQIPNSKNQEIQIYISPFDEPEGSLTYERLRRDLPDLVIEDSKILTTTNDIKALMFLSRNESLGRTREIWFTRGGNLYQITTYPEMDDVLMTIMKSWKFN